MFEASPECLDQRIAEVQVRLRNESPQNAIVDQAVDSVIEIFDAPVDDNACGVSLRMVGRMRGTFDGLEQERRRGCGFELWADSNREDAAREVVDDALDVSLGSVCRRKTVVSMCQTWSGRSARMPVFGWVGCIRLRGRRQRRSLIVFAHVDADAKTVPVR